MLEVGADVVVNPFTTPPGLTQFETAPVSVMFVNVPVLPATASVSVTTAVLLPEGMP